MGLQYYLVLNWWDLFRFYLAYWVHNSLDSFRWVWVLKWYYEQNWMINLKMEFTIHPMLIWHRNSKKKCLDISFRKLKVLFVKKDFSHLFLERGEGKEERERNINVWLPLMCPPQGTWARTQACAPTGNWTSNPLVCRPALSSLNHTSQGCLMIFLNTVNQLGWNLAYINTNGAYN